MNGTISIPAKRALAAIGGALFVLVAAWLCGYDYDERGGVALTVYLLTLICAAWFASIPID